MGLERIGEIGDRVSEGQVSEMCGEGFAVRFLVGIGLMDRSRESRIKVSSDKLFTEVRRVTKCG